MLSEVSQQRKTSTGCCHYTGHLTKKVEPAEPDSGTVTARAGEGNEDTLAEAQERSF